MIDTNLKLLLNGIHTQRGAARQIAQCQLSTDKKVIGAKFLELSNHQTNYLEA